MTARQGDSAEGSCQGTHPVLLRLGPLVTRWIRARSPRGSDRNGVASPTEPFPHGRSPRLAYASMCFRASRVPSFRHVGATLPTDKGISRTAKGSAWKKKGEGAKVLAPGGEEEGEGKSE
ncbi:hypothetical protein KM043_004275 [Ampulex compressa]|nr:hypothetical protein KM043_004275 [Ampulex compressa]